MSNIISIATQTGAYNISHNQVATFLEAHFADAIMARKYRLLARENSIGQKRTAIPDFDVEQPNPQLYQPGKTLPGTAERMLVYASEAMKMATSVAQQAITDANVIPQQINHVITVSCTGLSAPGLECMLIESLGLAKDTKRHTVNFMGCYAAFHALRLADMICKTQPDAHVLVVSVELCSLHFRHDTSDDNLLSTYLFSDGAAACIIRNTASENNRFLRCIDFDSVLLPEGKKDMAWHIGNAGFEMILNSAVPKLLQQNIAQAVDKIAYKNDASRSEIDHYAIHPGGKNILRAFSEALDFDDYKLTESYRVLYDCGNMSSATILFVLQRFLQNENKKPGVLYAAAFGPGLTVESGLFTLCESTHERKSAEENFIHITA